MSFGLKSLNDAGHAGIFFIVLSVALTLVAVVQSSVGSPVILGSSELCSTYSGLPESWLKNSRAGMIYVSGGEFTLGTTLGYEEERQEIKTRVQGFWIDQTEVTVAQFAAFVKATGYVTEAEREGGGLVFRQPSAAELNQRPYAWWNYQKGADWRYPDGANSKLTDNQPVTLVTFADAKAYADWLGRDLPTEAEWEYAAKSGRQGTEMEKEPRNAQGKPLANFWQGEFPTQNSTEDGHLGLAPVGCYPANAFKIYDMIGNAWEQTKDAYRESHQANILQNVSNESLKPDRQMVIKGGSHLCGRDFCVRYRPSAREAHEANLPTSHIGFRTVSRDISSSRLPDFTAW
jgi:formylglycine-generating enzyme required for sulfatase activity